MNRISKLGAKLLIGAISLSTIFSGVTDVSACGGRGGGGGGFGGGAGFGGGGYFRPPQANYQPSYYPQTQTYYPPVQSLPNGPVSYQQFPGGQQQPAGRCCTCGSQWRGPTIAVQPERSYTVQPDSAATGHYDEPHVGRIPKPGCSTDSGSSSNA